MIIELKSKGGADRVVSRLPLLVENYHPTAITLDKVLSYTYQCTRAQEVNATVSARAPDGTQFTAGVYMSKSMLILYDCQQEIPKLTVQLLAPILHTLCENKTVAQVYDERLLSIHGIYAIVLEPENAFAFDPLLQIKKQERQVEADEVEWVVNNYFEVGVKIRGRSFFLYKGRSLEYTEEKITTRPLGKRELGEVLRVNGEDQ